MRSREYQITLTDGKTTGTATLRLDGQCVEWLDKHGPRGEARIARLFEFFDYTIAHVRDIPDESEGAE